MNHILMEDVGDSDVTQEAIYNMQMGLSFVMERIDENGNIFDDAKTNPSELLV